MTLDDRAAVSPVAVARELQHRRVPQEDVGIGSYWRCRCGRADGVAYLHASEVCPAVAVEMLEEITRLPTEVFRLQTALVGQPLTALHTVKP